MWIYTKNDTLINTNNVKKFYINHEYYKITYRGEKIENFYGIYADVIDGKNENITILPERNPQYNIKGIEEKENKQEKEIKELLSNLEKIYSSLKEKNEDLLKLKEEQEKNLQESKENNKLVKRYEEIN